MFDYLGKSAGYGSFALRTHHLKQISQIVNMKGTRPLFTNQWLVFPMVTPTEVDRLRGVVQIVILSEFVKPLTSSSRKHSAVTLHSGKYLYTTQEQ